MTVQSIKSSIGVGRGLAKISLALTYASIHVKTYQFNRPGVVGAVLQTPL